MDKNIRQKLEVALSNGVKKTWFEKFPFFTAGFLSLVCGFAFFASSSNVNEMLLITAISFAVFIVCMACTIMKSNVLSLKLFE